MSSMSIGGGDALRAAELRRVEAKAAQLRADAMRSAADKEFRRAEHAMAGAASTSELDASAVDLYA